MITQTQIKEFKKLVKEVIKTSKKFKFKNYLDYEEFTTALGTIQYYTNYLEENINQTEMENNILENKQNYWNKETWNKYTE